MKRITIFWLSVAVCAASLGQAQDAATQERLDRMAGQIADLLTAQDAHRKAIEELGQRVENLREQVSKPAPVYASQDDLKRLADALKEAIKEVDRQRVQDTENTRQKLQELIAAITKMASRPPVEIRRPAPPPEVAPKPDRKAKESDKPEADTKAPEERGIKHLIKEGETLSAIIAACRAKGIKVTQDQIVKANPGLKPDRLKPGKEIFIPVSPP